MRAIDNPTIADAAVRTGDFLPAPEGKYAYARAEGFTEWLALAAILAETIAALMKACRANSAEAIIAMADRDSPPTRHLVYQEARKQVAKTFWLPGKLFFAGRINRIAADVASACLKSAAEAEPVRLRAVQAASLEV
jgi:hypothetical protein